MRLPGTGDGVARLVAVSMVKVDISRLSALLRCGKNRPANAASPAAASGGRTRRPSR